MDKILVINLRLWHYFFEADPPLPPPPHTHTPTHPPHIKIRTHVITGFMLQHCIGWGEELQGICKKTYHCFMLASYNYRLL